MVLIVIPIYLALGSLISSPIFPKSNTAKCPRSGHCFFKVSIPPAKQWVGVLSGFYRVNYSSHATQN